MNINELTNITNHAIGKSFDILTDNNYHTDTSIFNAYIALGIVPPTNKDHDIIWGILNGLKEIDIKSYTVGYLTFEDLEHRAALDKQLTEIVKKYI